MNKLIIILFVLSIFGCGSKKSEDKTTIELKKTEIRTPSIMCNMCVSTITNALNKIQGVTNVEVNLKTKTTTVEYSNDLTDLNSLVFAITEAGYDANDKIRNREVYEQLPACCKDGKY